MKKYDENGSTGSFIFTEQCYNSKQKEGISPSRKEKYSLIQDVRKDMLKELESPNVSPQLPSTMPKTTPKKKIAIIEDLSLDENLLTQEENLLTHQENQSKCPEQQFWIDSFNIQDISLEYLSLQNNTIQSDGHVNMKKSRRIPNSPPWKVALKLKMTESFSEDESVYSTDAYNENLTNLNGTYKVYYKQLFKLYVKAFFQSGSPNKNSIAKYLVKFFTAQQLEAIEISAHRKHILNAPIVPSRQAKLYQNQIGSIFYYTKQIQNFISPNLICQLDLYLHIPIVEDEHSFHKVIQKIKIATFIRYFLCQKYHGAEEVFKKIVV
jgi:hypothetical protein